MEIDNEQWRFSSTLSGSTINALPSLESNDQLQLQKLFEFWQ